MKTSKKISIGILVIILLFASNVAYWVLSDVQQECYLRVKKGEDLNLYEKCSMYSINICICTLGWFASPEATIQQILCTVPTKDTVVLHSKYFARHDKIKGLMKKYPNATKNNPALIAWKADYNEFKLWSAYTFKNGRIALALNGMYLYKEDDEWVISYIKEFAFPKLPSPTIIGPFKFHESLIRYMQDIGWLYAPQFKWVLDVEE